MGSALLRGHYEPYGTRLFVESVKPGMVVVDCGANIGIYTCLAAGAVGSAGKVYAFEPEPRNFRCLTETIRLNQLANVQAESLALSDRMGETELFLSQINMGDHRLGHAGEGRRSVAIRTVTLDSYWGNDVPEIDVLKMDIQGAEGLALLGMGETLARSKRLKIFMEFWPYGLRNCGSDPAKVIADLMALGFAIRHIDQNAGTLVTIADSSSLLARPDEGTSFDLLLERA